ncbi:MAG TPA: prepilin-type N-terminal cleavage/methylation domain-containing protein [Actinomycetota bacterium]|nr:prepilin-type N-terminal cleavage/methylation domain-containing protein [Actinomycetota bacterium]
MKEQREQGFTLIELLVVILIIAILAAIAIPVFLNQRKKGWAAAQQSALRNAAEAQESYATGNNGLYTIDEAELATEGYNDTSDVEVRAFTDATGTKFCMQAKHARGEASWDWKFAVYESDNGKPDHTLNTCPATYTLGGAALT